MNENTNNLLSKLLGLTLKERLIIVENLLCTNSFFQSSELQEDATTNRQLLSPFEGLGFPIPGIVYRTKDESQNILHT